MKRYWAVILTAATLVSCRSNQPATNPFMRTTVAPPGTTGVMVTPGQPYAQGISPPLVTQPAPVITTPAPVTTQPVPVIPGPPPAAPMTAPPSIAPQGDQFRYPGGSYIFHQSSNDPPPPAPDESLDTSKVQLASATMPVTESPVTESPATSGVTQAAGVEQVAHTEKVAPQRVAYVEPTRVYVSGPMSQAPIIENPYVTAKSTQPEGTSSRPPQTLTPQPAAQPLAAAQTQSQPASQPRTAAQPPAKPQTLVKPQSLAQTNATRQPTAPTRITLGGSRGDPPESSASFVPVASNSGGNTLRIVGESSPPTASSLVASQPTTQMSIAPPAPQPTATGSVMRVTAGATTPAIRSTVETSAGAANLAIKTSPSNSTTARIITPGDTTSEQDVIQTSFQPAKSNTTISISPPSR